MRRAADSSVTIPALLADHEAHAVAEAALAETEVTVAHAGIETYSVLTRLPAPLRLTAAQAIDLISARLPGEWITLDADALHAAMRRMADRGVLGGSAYDGLIALTAAGHDAELLTLDRRAGRSYDRLGIRFSLLSA